MDKPEDNTMAEGDISPARDLKLPFELSREISEFLPSLPNLHDNNARLAWISSAGLDTQLEKQITFAGSSVQFCQLLISTLRKYGKLEDGRNALEAVLEAAKKYVGKDKGEYCDTLIKKLRTILVEGPQFPNFSFIHHTTPFLAPPKPQYELVGRKVILAELKQQLLNGGRIALSALNGLPGVGKTALAVELAHDQEIREHFSDGVLWAGLGPHADSFSHLGTWMEALRFDKKEIAATRTTDTRIQKLKSKIGTGYFFVVIDDVWESEDAQSFNKLRGPNCAQLLTTRKPEIAIDFSNDPTSVAEISKEDSLKLLKYLAPNVFKIDDTKLQKKIHSQIDRLLQAVGGLPLALILIGQCLKKKSRNQRVRRLQKVLDELQQIEIRLKHKEPLAEGKISLQAVIALSDENLSEDARFVLRTLSVFPAKPNTFSEAAALAVSKKSVTVLDTLEEAGLLETFGKDRYVVHQTIADYVALKMSEFPHEEQEEIRNRHSTYYAEFLKHQETQLSSETPKEALNNIEIEMANIRLMWKRAGKMGQEEILQKAADVLYSFYKLQGALKEKIAKQEVDFELMAKVMLFQGRFFYEIGQYTDVQDLYEHSLEILEHVISSQDPKVATIQNDLAMLYLSIGKYKDAEPLFRQALEIRENRLGLEHPDVATSLNNLASLYYFQGNYKEAESLYQRSLEIREKVLGLEHPNRADSLNNIAKLYHSQEKYVEAESYFKQAREIWENVLGSEHPRVATVLHNLAELYRSQKKYEKAKPLYQQALEIREKTLGPVHLDVATSSNNLAMLYSSQGKYEDAEPLLERSLTIYERALGIEHSRTKKVSMSLKELREKHQLQLQFGTGGGSRYAYAGLGGAESIVQIKTLPMVGKVGDSKFNWLNAGLLSIPKQQHVIGSTYKGSTTKGLGNVETYGTYGSDETGPEQYQTHFHGTVEGIVIGDNNTVTIRFTNGQQQAVPFLAPSKPPYQLVGCDDFLIELKQRLLTDNHVGFWALHGLSGVGKTAITLALASDHNVLAHFVGGVLWVKLGVNAEPFRLLGNWMEALGFPNAVVESTKTCREQMERLQGEIGTRRMLLVIDDVRNAEDALWFKVGGADCVHLLTTRDEYIASEFAGENTSIALDTLSFDDSLKLLKQFAELVVEQYTQEIEKLVYAVNGLPSGLILIGKYLQKESDSRNSRRIRRALEFLLTHAEQGNLISVLSEKFL